jgi:cytochrome c oxidase assembly protein subunit 15
MAPDMRRFLLGPYSLLAAQRAALVALGFQLFIVVSGATVRLTGSGLGCPNWPTCTETRPVPAIDQHQLIEFINRMNATPTLLAALAALWTCWRLASGRRIDLRIATTITVIGIFAQAVVGAFTVILELPPEIVAVHFVLSLVPLASSMFAWHASRSKEALRLRRDGQPIRAITALIMLVSLLSVILAGVLTTASGPHSGASGTGQQVDRFEIFDLAVTLHARGAYVFLGLVLVLSWWRSRRGPALRDLGLLAALVALQITLGEIQYRTGLPWGVVLAHVANAVFIWVIAVRITIDALVSSHPDQ